VPWPETAGTPGVPETGGCGGTPIVGVAVIVSVPVGVTVGVSVTVGEAVVAVGDGVGVSVAVACPRMLDQPKRGCGPDTSAALSTAAAPPARDGAATASGTESRVRVPAVALTADPLMSATSSSATDTG